MGTTFLPAVLVGRRFLRMRFALGATMALRRNDLERFGGFARVEDYLADDYQLGAGIASLGLRVILSDFVIASVLGYTTFQEQWDREVRWARCIRVNRPLDYWGLILTFSTPLVALFACSLGFAPLGWLAIGFSLILRWLVAWLVTGSTGDRAARQWLVWLPI